LFIALLYYLPYVIWKYLLRAHVGRNKTTGTPIDISGIINLLNETEVYKIKEFNKTVAIASDYLHHCFVLNESTEYDLIDYDIDNGLSVLFKFKFNQVLFKKDLNSNPFFFLFIQFKGTVNRASRNQRPRRNSCLQRLGSYSIVAKYFLIKIAYIANSVAVFWFMNLFLKFDSGFVLYGWRVINALVQDNVADMNALWESKYFPRAVTCKLKVRQQDEIYPEFSFNCGLPANVFNEKIFMVLWTWFTIVLVFNLYGLFKWFHRLVQRKRILVDYMGCILQSNAFNSQNALVDSFLDDYVSIDGFFAFEMIRVNTGNVCTRRLVECLWKTYSDSCTANLDNFQTPKNSDSKTKKGDYNDDRSPTPNVVPTSADIQPSRKNFFNTGNSVDDKDAQRNLLQKSDNNSSYSPFQIIKPNNDIV
jgi:hypothetical protein